MRVAFYAPLNAPDGDKPSGERLIARMLTRALEDAGHDVTLASRFRGFDADGDGTRIARLAAVGQLLAERLVGRYRTAAETDRPRLWLTYHLYHKAPDWLGPAVARALSIPYAVVEASFATKQANGPWAIGHRGVATALKAADLVIGLNSRDREGVLPRLQGPDRYLQLAPFIDCAPFARAALDRARHRAVLAARLGTRPRTPILLAVGMMRPGAKLASYRLLARALQMLVGECWRLAIVGDGAEEIAVREAFRPLEDRVSFLGRQAMDDVPALYAGADLLVWPAIKEAMGMCFLEAQAAGTPVVGADNLGVPDVVDDGVTGLLPAYNDADAFATAVLSLLRDFEHRRRMGAAATGYALACHDLRSAGRRFVAGLEALVDARPRSPS